jgi:blocked-early-in-transport protein 1
MSSSREHAEDTYESQNDQRLDELHSKIRTLRGVSDKVGAVDGLEFCTDQTPR